MQWTPAESKTNDDDLVLRTTASHQSSFVSYSSLESFHVWIQRLPYVTNIPSPNRTTLRFGFICHVQTGLNHLSHRVEHLHRGR